MRHRFHSLCPYFAMFPESFAEKWIGQLTRRNDIVLDPFSGRGTTAFQALLMGRQAVATDVNDVAYCLTKAKTSAPSVSSVRRRLTQLENGFDGRAWRHEADSHGEFFRLAFARRVFQQLLYLRSTLKWHSSNVDSMVAALALGSLHGEMDKSQSYFSNQMPRTISTKPAYSVRFWKQREYEPPDRDVFAILRQRLDFRYRTPPPDGNAFVYHQDIRKLPRIRNRLPAPIRCAITSPPYLDVTNFEEDQWLRLWFLGGPPYPTIGRVSRDDRHSDGDKYWRFIADMWRVLGVLLAPKAHVVIRIGTGRLNPTALARALTASSQFSARKVELLSSETSELKNRQTDVFRPGSKGCSVELDCHFRFAG